MIRIDPETGVRIGLDAQRADQAGASEIDFDMTFAHEGGEGATPYEVLLSAALVGDSSHFTRQDNVEECWRVVAPLLEHPPKAIVYPQGSWGPPEAERLAKGTAGGTSRGCQAPGPARPPSSATPGEPEAADRVRRRRRPAASEISAGPSS